MADFDPRSQAWPDFAPDEIVRRVRCLADDEPDEGDSPAQIWRHACDTILLRMGKHPSQIAAAVEAPETTLPGGEVEGLVDALIEAARSRGAKGMACAMRLPSACAQVADADDNAQSARTALLAVIRSSGGGEEKGASPDGVGLSQVEPASGLNPSDFDPPRIPAGWRLLPEVPTDDMLDAAVKGSAADVSYADVEELWPAILSAAPHPSQEKGEADA